MCVCVCVCGRSKANKILPNNFSENKKYKYIVFIIIINFYLQYRII